MFFGWAAIRRLSLSGYSFISVDTILCLVLYICNQCGYDFSDKVYMKMHMKNSQINVLGLGSEPSAFFGWCFIFATSVDIIPLIVYI